MSWRQKLNAKVGDTVYSRHWGQIRLEGKICRVTPSGRFFVGTVEYNADGAQRGSSRGFVQIADEAIIAEAKAQGQRRRLEHRYGETHPRNLTDDQLARIVAILDEPKAETTKNGKSHD